MIPRRRGRHSSEVISDRTQWINPTPRLERADRGAVLVFDPEIASKQLAQSPAPEQRCAVEKGRYDRSGLIDIGQIHIRIQHVQFLPFLGKFNCVRVRAIALVLASQKAIQPHRLIISHLKCHTVRNPYESLQYGRTRRGSLSGKLDRSCSPGPAWISGLIREGTDKMKRALFSLLLMAGLLSLAPGVLAQDVEGDSSFLPECAVAPTDADSDTANEEADTDATAEESEDAADAEEAPKWQTLTLTEVTSGEELAVVDLEGCVVLFHPMATWCGSCWAHLNEVKTATAELEPGTFAVFAVSVEAGMPDDMLAGYSDVSEFDFLFAVASEDMMNALNDEFGRSALNPPATPHVYIAPDGSFSDLQTGGSSAEEIVTTMQSLSDTEGE